MRRRLEHQWEIVQVYGCRDFPPPREELSAWIGDRAWTTGEGPRALFGGAVAWLRERRVLLPGLSVLTRLGASVREAATERLWETLAAKPAPAQARLLNTLLDVPPGGRLSDLDRLGKGPTSPSGLDNRRNVNRGLTRPRPQSRWCFGKPRIVSPAARRGSHRTS